jgi:thymidylate synthase (FAD)
MQHKIELYDDGIGAVEYVSHMGDDLTVVNSARVSFGKHKTYLEASDEKLIKYLIKHKHTSTLEHCAVTFRFTVPLFIRSQHHRHRTWSYNEISRRYTDFDIQFYAPRTFRTQAKDNRQASTYDVLTSSHIAAVLVEEHHLQSMKLFDWLIEEGVCREQARGVLPQNMYTQYYGTANLNNILKFIDLRIHEGAQQEIQVMAQAVLDIITEIFPVTVGAYRKIKNNE